MGSQTKIEWTDATWNPLTGCSSVSAGCRNCYAARMAKRLAGRCGYPKEHPFRVTFHRDKLDEPKRWKNPRRIFVCSMGDLWHPDVRQEDRAAVLRATNLAPQHTYIFLTKRPENVVEDFSGSPNFWLGVSVENQQAYEQRAYILASIPAVVRFWSMEPLLGPVELADDWWESANRPDWVIVGGESGPAARPMHPDWVRSIRYQCLAAGVPWFFKSWGEWAPKRQLGVATIEQFWKHRNPTNRSWGVVNAEGHFSLATTPWNGHDDDGHGDEAVMLRVGKKHSGRTLDGREWNDFPES